MRKEISYFDADVSMVECARRETLESVERCA